MYTLVAQIVKDLSAVQTMVQSLGQKDPLEMGMASHSSILARSLVGFTVHGVSKSQTPPSD